MPTLPSRVETFVDSSAHNRAVEARELAIWAEAPDRFTAYYDFPEHHEKGPRVRWAQLVFYPRLTGATVKTWLGTSLGRIIAARVYRHNLGGRFVALSVKGSNGAIYYGRASWDNGSVIHLRKARG